MKLFKSWIIYIMFVWILACQVLFILIQEGFGQKVIDSIQGQLRQELAISNFNFLARSITDFTVSGAIECGVLDKVTPINQRIIDLRYMSPKCSINKWALDGVKINVKLNSLNGDIYDFQFISKNPSLFYFALWGFRILGGLAILGIAFAIKAVTRSELEVAKRMKKMALQVSHDIRSPLSALSMTLKDKEFSNLEERKVILNSLERIQDIANNLLQNEKENRTNNLQSVLVVPMINSVLSEKRYQFKEEKSLKIVTDFRGESFLCTQIHEGTFKRVLSNIINNAIEASEDACRLNISLVSDGDYFKLSIKDNGQGIPLEIINKVGIPGFSSKSSQKGVGTGLGLSSAIEFIEQYGGKLSIDSKEGVGTEVSIRLPVSTPPNWLVKSIKINQYDEVWVLDDDSSIHFIWKKKLGNNIRTFSSIESFRQELIHNERKRRLFLIDFELGADQTGLELIEELGISDSSILVTSVFNSCEIQERVILNKMGVIPKFLIDQVSIEGAANSIFDYVYIDDDYILRLGWENLARKKDMKLLTLATIGEFNSYVSQISKEGTKIYIDSNLGEGSIRGEEFARVLHAEGYKLLYLATGYEKDQFSSYPWLKVQGKECPL